MRCLARRLDDLPSALQKPTAWCTTRSSPRMPSNEEGEHALQLALPPNLQGGTNVWVVRFTGETFTEYE